MLDKSDLQAIQELVDGSIGAAVTASEERLKTYVDGSIGAAITASEERLKTYVDSSIGAAITASEERLKTYVDGSIGAAIGASEERLKIYVDSSIGAAENRWQAFYEAAIVPQFQLLAEGHQTLLDTLSPKARVDALEDEVIFMKSVIKALSQEVAELKKAQ